MADFIPVEGNPFEKKDDPKMVPVSHNPFAARSEQTYALDEVPAAVGQNAGRSAMKQIDGLAHLVTSPGEVAEGVWDLGKGLASKAMRKTGLTDWLASIGKSAPEAAVARDIEKQKAGFREKTADEAGDALQHRYGGWLGGPGKWGFTPEKGWENLKRTVAEDPVGAGFDALTLGSLGALTPGRMAMRTTTGTARAVDAAVVRPVSELLSGVSSEAQRLATRAGELGGAEGQAFRANMRRPDWEGMQRTGQEGVSGMRRERANEWLAREAELRANPSLASYVPVGQAIIDAGNEVRGVGNYLKKPAALDALREVAGEVRGHSRVAGINGYTSPFAMNELKQRIGDIAQRLPEGSPERRVVGNVRRAVREEVTRAAPEYRAMLDSYGTASANINEVIKSLGLGERSTRFSTAGKLLSAMRSDASVARGARGDALADVARHAPTLPYQLAGATMNPMLPRGIVGRGKAALEIGAGVGAGAATATGFLGHLAGLLPILAMSSPRAVGSMRYGVGSAVRGARAAGLTQRNIGALLEAERIVAELKDE